MCLRVWRKRGFLLFFGKPLCIILEPETNSLGWQSCYTSGYVSGSCVSNPTFQVTMARERDRMWSRGGYILCTQYRTVGWDEGVANPGLLSEVSGTNLLGRECKPISQLIACQEFKSRNTPWDLKTAFKDTLRDGVSSMVGSQGE